MKLSRLTVMRHTLGAIAGLVGITILSELLPPYRNLQLAQASYLLCAAAGLSVLSGASGQISAGQGAFMAVGAYTTALLINHLHLPLALVLLASVATAGTIGAVVGVAAARLRGLYLAGATLAVAIGLPALADYRGLSHLLQGQNGLSVTISPPPRALGETFPLERWQAWITALCAVITLWFLANLTHSAYGRSLRAARDNEQAAALTGIHIAHVRIAAFTVAAACAGLGGGLLAWVNSLAAPGAFTLDLSLGLVTAVVLGGLDSLAGAVWGSLLLVLIPSWTSDLSSAGHLPTNIANNLPTALYGAALIAVILAFPGGIHHALRRLRALSTTNLRSHLPRRSRD